MSETKLSWKPRHLSGGVYCSSACGHNCSRSQYDGACQMSRLLADALGPGWKPEVWENLGWHYRAVSKDGRIKVYPSTGRAGRIIGYSVLVGIEANSGGYWHGCGRTAKSALRNTLLKVRKDAKTRIANLQGLLENVI